MIKKRRGATAKVQICFNSAHTSRLAHPCYHTVVELLLLYNIIMLRYVTCLPEDLTVKTSRSHLCCLYHGQCRRTTCAARGKALLLIIRHGRRRIDFKRSSRSILSRRHGPTVNTRVGHRFKNPDLCAHIKGLK